MTEVSAPEFQAFAKIPRLRRDCVVTEKIDGTNAQIYIEDGVIFAGSRRHWLAPASEGSKQSDNFGFAAWVAEHADALLSLGAGHHFGEWYGRGIQRGYGLDHRRFALFNLGRWEFNADLPDCCEIVPKLYEGPFNDGAIESSLQWLRDFGSMAAPGFAHAEGIVVHLSASNALYKVTLENDASPKELVAA